VGKIGRAGRPSDRPRIALFARFARFQVASSTMTLSKFAEVDELRIGCKDGGMSPEQCRAARAWLDWSQDDLAQRARVSSSTIRDLEAGRRVPIPNNMLAISRAFEEAGIVLTSTDNGIATGIAVRSQAVQELLSATVVRPAQRQPPSEANRPRFFIEISKKR
jgi:DNA-binding XRE family transcriptional regulator